MSDGLAYMCAAALGLAAAFQAYLFGFTKLMTGDWSDIYALITYCLILPLTLGFIVFGLAYRVVGKRSFSALAWAGAYAAALGLVFALFGLTVSDIIDDQVALNIFVVVLIVAGRFLTRRTTDD